MNLDIVKVLNQLTADLEGAIKRKERMVDNFKDKHPIHINVGTNYVLKVESTNDLYNVIKLRAIQEHEKIIDDLTNKIKKQIK